MRFFIFFILIATVGCSNTDEKVLSAFDVYCEMVANDAKPVALHYPMAPAEIDDLWAEFTRMADRHAVKLYREDSFPVSLLFPKEATADKSVVLIYKGARLKQYEQWKEDLTNSEIAQIEEQLKLARRFGRLLGYSPQGINDLLSKSSTYRSLTSFGVTQQVTHLYYDDVEQALAFYGDKLGLEHLGDNLLRVSTDAFIKLHGHNSEHPKNQPKSTAIAFLTDQLPQWYAHVQEQGIPIKYRYKPKDGGPHDGFVAIDPEGSLLEFEEFKQHPENELFMATLANSQRVETAISGLTFFGSITWTYHKDVLRMENFYNDILGYTLVADQGWTKIYQTSSSGFIGLVDERRGMEDYADNKLVEIEWKILETELFDRYASENWGSFNYQSYSLIGPENYTYRFTGR